MRGAHVAVSLQEGKLGREMAKLYQENQYRIMRLESGRAMLI